MEDILNDTLDAEVTGYLSIASGKVESKYRKIFLKGQQVSVGRDVNNDIVFKLLQISGKHCNFTWNSDTNKWSVHDTSKNRITVNGTNISKEEATQLSDGDSIGIIPIGQVTIFYTFHEIDNEDAEDSILEVDKFGAPITPGVKAPLDFVNRNLPINPSFVQKFEASSFYAHTTGSSFPESSVPSTSRDFDNSVNMSMSNMRKQAQYLADKLETALNEISRLKKENEELEADKFKQQEINLKLNHAIRTASNQFHELSNKLKAIKKQQATRNLMEAAVKAAGVQNEEIDQIFKTAKIEKSKLDQFGIAINTACIKYKKYEDKFLSNRIQDIEKLEKLYVELEAFKDGNQEIMTQLEIGESIQTQFLAELSAQLESMGLEIINNYISENYAVQNQQA